MTDVIIFINKSTSENIEFAKELCDKITQHQVKVSSFALDSVESQPPELGGLPNASGSDVRRFDVQNR